MIPYFKNLGRVLCWIVLIQACETGDRGAVSPDAPSVGPSAGGVLLRPRIVTQLGPGGTLRNVSDTTERKHIASRVDNSGMAASEAMTKAIAPAIRAARIARADQPLPNGAAVWVVRPAGGAAVIILSPDYTSDRFVNLGYGVLGAQLIRGFNPESEVVIPVGPDLRWSMPGEAPIQGFGQEADPSDASPKRLAKRFAKGARITIAGVDARLLP